MGKEFASAQRAITSLSPSFSQLEPQLKTDLLAPVEMQNLEPGTSYQVSGRCRVENGGPWGEWSPDLFFQTPFLRKGASISVALLGLGPPQVRQPCPSNCTCLCLSSSAPKDVWISGAVCETAGNRAALLLWKVSAKSQCLQGSGNAQAAVPSSAAPWRLFPELQRSLAVLVHKHHQLNRDLRC